MITKHKTLRHPRVIELPLHVTNKQHIKVKTNDYVTIGKPLTHKTYGAYATVSGVVKAIESINDDIHVFIENDRLDHHYDQLKHFNAKDLVKRYFKTYEPFESWSLKSLEHLHIQMFFRNEPFVSLDPVNIKELINPIEKVILKLIKLYDLKSVTLLTTKTMDEELFKTLKTKSEKVYTQVIDIKEEDHIYKYINASNAYALMHQKPYQLITLESLLHLHELTINNRPPTMNQIIISGDVINEPTLVDVRIGTHFKDITELIGHLRNAPDYKVLLNHMLKEDIYHTLDFPVEIHMHSFHITEPIERKTYDCISCGDCNDHCPVGILPSKIYHAVEKEKLLSHLKPTLCIECGLCSFYCPSKIPVMTFVKEAKTLIRRHRL